MLKLNPITFELAKLRAIRILFAQLLKKHGGSEDTSCFIHAITKLSKTEEKDYTNMLRVTTRAMSAVLGGCDSLEVVPFDGEESDFSLRIARNVQLILQGESYLDKIVDPAAGSYYVETLTTKIVESVSNEKVMASKRGAVNRI